MVVGLHGEQKSSVLITGGTSGLGLEIAQHYIKLGYKTVIFSKNKKLLKKILAIMKLCNLH